MVKMSSEQFLEKSYARMEALVDEMDVMSPDSKEYADCYDELAKIAEQVDKIERRKEELAKQMRDDANTKRELDIKESQVKADQSRAEAENKKAKFGLWTAIIGLAGTTIATVVPTIEGVWGTKRITQYEETGAVTSKAYQGTIHKPKWKF